MKTDKTALLAAERQAPFTAAEHAQATGHQAEYVRDVPRTCACVWSWSPAARAYVRLAGVPDCPWDAPEGGA